MNLMDDASLPHDLERRMQAEFPTLSEQLQRAARHVLERREDVALLSMRALAQQAGVQPATMVRLARRLGFPDYKSFREPFCDRVRNPNSSFQGRARELQARQQSSTDDLISACLSGDVANLDNIHRTIDGAELEECAALIAGARKVYVIGRRSCYPVAYSFFYAYQMLHENGVLLGDQASFFQGDLSTVVPGDVMLAISFDPYTHETVTAVRHAVEVGAVVVAVTDTPVSPLAQQSAHTLVVANASPAIFQSIVGALAVVQMLIALLVVRGGKTALAAVEKREEDLWRLNAYWIDKERRPTS